MTAPRHLVAVWNPAYASDAMDAHLVTLLEWASQGDPEEAYVWWGKLRSANRQQPLPHTAEKTWWCFLPCTAPRGWSGRLSSFAIWTAR